MPATARLAAYTAGQTAHAGYVAEHDLGAAAYASTAARAAEPSCMRRQRSSANGNAASFPVVRELVIDYQTLCNDICWSAFVD